LYFLPLPQGQGVLRPIEAGFVFFADMPKRLGSTVHRGTVSGDRLDQCIRISRRL
jgi:hypothetical protein